MQVIISYELKPMTVWPEQHLYGCRFNIVSLIILNTAGWHRIQVCGLHLT